MEYVSLFAGIGGLDLGLDQAGHTCIEQVEIDAACCNVLGAHWPGVKRVRDVRGYSAPVGVDLIAGGFPCTDISALADRWGAKGVAGERSGLWYEFERIIREARPTWALIENTGRLRNGRAGTDLAAVVEGLDAIPYMGIGLVLDAGAFGLPARRPRVFILARRGGDSSSLSDWSRLAERAHRNDPGLFILERAGQSLAADYGCKRPNPGSYRKLTPEECEEMLGFPRGWTAGQSATTRYKQCGNAVAVPCGKWFGDLLAAPSDGDVAADTLSDAAVV